MNGLDRIPPLSMDDMRCWIIAIASVITDELGDEVGAKLFERASEVRELQRSANN